MSPLCASRRLLRHGRRQQLLDERGLVRRGSPLLLDLVGPAHGRVGPHLLGVGRAGGVRDRGALVRQQDRLRAGLPHEVREVADGAARLEALLLDPSVEGAAVDRRGDGDGGLFVRGAAGVEGGETGDRDEEAESREEADRQALGARVVVGGGVQGGEIQGGLLRRGKADVSALRYRVYPHFSRRETRSGCLVV